MENKIQYELPTVEVTYFEISDILTTSDNIHLPGVGWGDSTGT